MKTSRRLLQSGLFSLGVHAFLILPIVSGIGLVSLPRFDVTRGESSVEIELVGVPEESEGEELVIPSAPLKEPWVDDGGAIFRARASLFQNSPPRYPWAARVQGWEGRVLLRVFVTPEGRANQVYLKHSSGYPVLDGAALSTVRQWQFTPAQRGGQKVASVVEVPITFQLKD